MLVYPQVMAELKLEMVKPAVFSQAQRVWSDYQLGSASLFSGGTPVWVDAAIPSEDITSRIHERFAGGLSIFISRVVPDLFRLVPTSTRYQRRLTFLAWNILVCRFILPVRTWSHAGLAALGEIPPTYGLEHYRANEDIRLVLDSLIPGWFV